ncbi:hypothetical protein EST38_g10817 [Candolleomyces aberdarensis]|uniref:CCHC-type domain-containing protein n=1 Tax=Candolleomyces aberdarensis TaxID=2316362 RepID=A0A4Q2D6F0_9AGAR|nr:hypothetical protein EST38_g10817 [Candolleomyces aberdarensis]
MRKKPSGVSTSRSTINTTGFTRTENARRKDTMGNDGWTTITGLRRAHSLDSASRSEAAAAMNVGEEQALALPVLTTEQNAAVDDAVQQLTQDEHAHLARRYDAVQTAGAGNEEPGSSNSDSSDDSSVRSIEPQAGPSRDKGKAVDPRNWGDIDWDSDELNVEAQAAALEQLKKRKRKSKKKSKTKSAALNIAAVHVPTTPEVDSLIDKVPRRERSVLPLPSFLASMNPPRAPARLGVPVRLGTGLGRGSRRAFSARPSAQIPPKSGLVVALQAAERLQGNSGPASKPKKSDKKKKKKSNDKKAKKAKSHRKKRARRSRRDPSPSDSSSPSDTDSSSDSSDSDSDNDSRPRRRRVPRQPDDGSSPSGSSTSSDSSSNSSDSESSSDEEDTRISKHVLSGMKVFRYDGSQNIRNFSRHVREVVSSLKMNRVPKKYQVEVAARSLEKKAYDYYEQRIANNAANWTVSQMYEALFNHIFPMDFRVRCRGRFNSLTQGTKTVNEFAFELEELADLIGEITEREKKEEEELRAANKCFLCKEIGHMKRNCPRANSVKSSSKRPPGVSNFNVEFAGGDDVMEGVIDSLECNAMSVSYDDFEFSDYEDSEEEDEDIMFLTNRCPRRVGHFVKPNEDLDRWPLYWHARRPQLKIGNAYTKVAENILNSSQPYPGDEDWLPKDKVLEHRFSFIQEYIDDHLLWDKLLERYYTIEARDLRDPDFTPADWYARIRQIEANLPADETPLNCRRMGDAVGYVAECTLRDGVVRHYPSPLGARVDAEDRFRVQRHSSKFYIITDYVRRSRTKIETAHLLNRNFNLVRWYELLVQRRRSFCQRETPFDPEPANRWSPLPFSIEDMFNSYVNDELLFENDEEEEGNFSGPAETSSIPDLMDVDERELTEEDMGDDDILSVYYPFNEIGDPYKDRLQETLKRGAPYPGEKPLAELTTDEVIALNTRFCVERCGKRADLFEIHDTHLEQIFYVPESFATDPRSNPGLWYAHKRSRNLQHHDRELAAWSLSKLPGQTVMGAPMEVALERILRRCTYRQNSVLTDPHDSNRFCVSPGYARNGTVKSYTVMDRGLGIVKDLPAARLRFSEFNPAKWYQVELDYHFTLAELDDSPLELPIDPVNQLMQSRWQVSKCPAIHIRDCKGTQRL